jgi:hypothetical protein
MMLMTHGDVAVVATNLHLRAFVHRFAVSSSSQSQT